MNSVARFSTITAPVGPIIQCPADQKETAMTFQSSMKIQPPATPETLGSCWKLASGHCDPAAPAVEMALMLARFTTLDGLHTGPATRDLLDQRQRLNGKSGQRVVTNPGATLLTDRPTLSGSQLQWSRAVRWYNRIHGRRQVQPARDMGVCAGAAGVCSQTSCVLGCSATAFQVAGRAGCCRVRSRTSHKTDDSGLAT